MLNEKLLAPNVLRRVIKDARWDAALYERAAHSPLCIDTVERDRYLAQYNEQRELELTATKELRNRGEALT